VKQSERLFRVLINENKNLKLIGNLLSRLYLEQNNLERYDNLKQRIGIENVCDRQRKIGGIGSETKMASVNLNDAKKLPMINS
jgi:hypothetical protein